MYSIVFILCVVVLSINNGVQGQGYQYRPRINGWLKLHKIARTWQGAYDKCRNEGAVLAAPLNEEMVSEMRYLINSSSPNTPQFIDVKARYVPGVFVSTEGIPLDMMPVADMIDLLDIGSECLTMDGSHIRGSICIYALSFICYKEHNENEPLTECGTFDQGYKFVEATGSCYKFHEQLLTWNDAYAKCADEGAYLAILNDQKEAEIASKIIRGSEYNAYLGMHANPNAVWTSIHGHPIKNIFNNWDLFGNQPTDTNNQCAILFWSDTTLYPLPCNTERSFLCEKDPSQILFPIW